MKLVDARGLLEALFDEDSRPSLRWIREQQANRTIPYVKIGHFVRFHVPSVIAALKQHNTVNPRA